MPANGRRDLIRRLKVKLATGIRNEPSLYLTKWKPAGGEVIYSLSPLWNLDNVSQQETWTHYYSPKNSVRIHNSSEWNVITWKPSLRPQSIAFNISSSTHVYKLM